MLCFAHDASMVRSFWMARSLCIMALVQLLVPFEALLVQLLGLAPA